MGSKKDQKKIVLFVVIFIAAFIAMKLFSHLVFPKTVFAASFNVMRFDCMLMGSLGAIYYYNRHSLFLKITTSKPAQAIAWSVILLLLLNIFHIASIIDHEIVSAITVILILGQITIKNRLVNLENKVCDFLGKISYGIYVIHPLIIFFSAYLFKNLLLPSVLKYILAYTFVVGSTVFFSWVSYEYFEKRFLKIKLRFTTVASSNTRNS